LFAGLLLLACDVSPAGSGQDRGAATSDKDERGVASDDELPASASESTPDDDQTSAPSAESGPNGAVAAPASSAPDQEPADMVAPAADKDVSVTPRWFIKGSTSPAFALGSAQKAALQAGADVQLSLLSAAGAAKVVASAKVDLDGKFSLELPVAISVDLAIAHLLDLSGHVIGSVIVGGGKGKPDSVLNLVPISAETSLEVDVLLAALKCPCPPARKPSALSLALDASALIDANLSNSLDAALKLGAKLDVVTAGLADALVATAHARAEVLADLGVELDANVLLAAQLSALSELGQGLVAVASGNGKLAEVGAKLALSLDDALALSGKLAADLRVRTQVAGSLAFSSSLSGSFKADPKLNASVFAALHSAATLDAEITVNAVLELLKNAGASSVDIQAALTAGLKLKADVAVAIDVQALVDARNDFIAAVCGKSSASGGLVGGLLSGVTGTVAGVLDGLLGSVLKLSVNLDAKLSLDLAAVASVDACASVDASLSLDATLSALADTLAKFDADVHASASNANTDAAAKILVSAQLFGRAAI
jgi:hypothetical protein